MLKMILLITGGNTNYNPVKFNKQVVSYLASLIQDVQVP